VRLIPPDSPTALAIAIEDLADNPELREEMGNNARELSGRFTWETIATQTAAYYAEILDMPR